MKATAKVVTDTSMPNRMQVPVSLYKGTKDPTVQKVLPFAELLQEIQSENDAAIETANQLKHFYKVNKIEYAKRKEKLWAFSIGQFAKRTDKDVEIYVPLLVFDVDGIGSSVDTDFLWSACKSCPYVFAAFPSISGHGLRILVWTNARPSTHKSIYQSVSELLSAHLNIPLDKELRLQYKSEGLDKDEMQAMLKETAHLDTSTSNISRLWFYSCVSKNRCYVNTDSQVFEYTPNPSQNMLAVKKKDNHFEPKNNKPQQLDDALKTAICKKMLEKRAIASGRNNYVFALAKILYEHGVSESYLMTECLKEKESDFDENEIQRTVRSALKTATFQKYSNQQLLHYQRISQGGKPAQSINITPSNLSTKPGPELDKPKKKNKYMQMKNHLSEKYDFRLNEISIEIEYKLKDEQEYKILNENNLLIEFLEAGYTSVESYLIALLKSNFVPRYNPFEEYFFSLEEWDESQADYIYELANYVQASDQEWFNLQFKKMLVRSVACALNVIPFNKHCFTLLGKQNDGKTSFLRFLCPPQLDDYIKENLDIHNKDGRISLCQNLFINLDELANFSKYDINRTKAFFTLDKVKERLPYDRKASNHLRRASFLASTNSDEFLTDETGNVRWLVFEINGVLHDNGGKHGYNRNIDIDMVYSQAYSLLRSGFDFKLSPTEISKSEVNNKNYQVTTVEQELIQSFFEPAKEEDENKIDVSFMTSTDILTKLEVKTSTRLNIRNIGKALKLLGYQRTQKRIKELNGISLLKPQPRKGFYVRNLMQ